MASNQKISEHLADSIPDSQGDEAKVVKPKPKPNGTAAAAAPRKKTPAEQFAEADALSEMFSQKRNGAAAADDAPSALDEGADDDKEVTDLLNGAKAVVADIEKKANGRAAAASPELKDRDGKPLEDVTGTGFSMTPRPADAGAPAAAAAEDDETAFVGCAKMLGKKSAEERKAEADAKKLEEEARQAAEKKAADDARNAIDARFQTWLQNAPVVRLHKTDSAFVLAVHVGTPAEFGTMQARAFVHFDERFHTTACYMTINALRMMGFGFFAAEDKVTPETRMQMVPPVRVLLHDAKADVDQGPFKTFINVNVLADLIEYDKATFLRNRKADEVKVFSLNLIDDSIPVHVRDVMNVKTVRNVIVKGLRSMGYAARMVAANSDIRNTADAKQFIEAQLTKLWAAPSKAKAKKKDGGAAAAAAAAAGEPVPPMAPKIRKSTKRAAEKAADKVDGEEEGADQQPKKKRRRTTKKKAAEAEAAAAAAEPVENDEEKAGASTAPPPQSPVLAGAAAAAAAEDAEAPDSDDVPDPSQPIPSPAAAPAAAAAEEEDGKDPDTAIAIDDDDAATEAEPAAAAAAAAEPASDRTTVVSPMPDTQPQGGGGGGTAASMPGLETGTALPDGDDL